MNEMTGAERKALIDDIMAKHGAGLETLGTCVRRLRLEVTGFDQETFAAMCDLSTRALYQLESDKGNPTLKTIDGVLRKFGLQMGIVAAQSKRKSTVRSVHAKGLVEASVHGYQATDSVVTKVRTEPAPKRGSKPQSSRRGDRKKEL
ncbi:helix-turn-helix domain-containing protein [Pseudomonas sp. SH1-B]